MTVEYLTGAALDVTRTLPDASVDLATCSPPFLALRNYNGVEGQWGSESGPAEFLDNLLELAVETRRVLAPHGSLAWELGDTYSGSGGSGDDYNAGGMRAEQAKFLGSAARNAKDVAGHKDRWASSDKRPGWPLAKSLTGVPTLFAWSLAYGRNLLNPAHEFEPWRIRNVIVWARNNPPVGALGDKVRPATSYITVATPSPKRWFDLDAVRLQPRPENQRGTLACEGKSERATLREATGAPPNDHWQDEYDGDLTWLVNTQGSSLAHYAMWPAKLAERIVLSMCPPEVCRQCGEPRRRLVCADAKDRLANRAKSGFASRDGREWGPTAASGFTTTTTTTIGWSDCGHGDYRSGVVLDQFAGTGTTLHVAELRKRDAIGIDLDPDNRKLLAPRRVEVRKTLTGEQPQVVGQIELFAS